MHRPETSPCTHRGTQKGGQLPQSCPPGCLVGFCGRGFDSGFIPTRGHWKLNELGRRMPLGQVYQVWKFLCHHFYPYHHLSALASLTAPPSCQMEHGSFSSDLTLGFVRVTLNDKEKKERREMQDDDKKATTKLGAPFLSPGYLGRIGCFL